VTVSEKDTLRSAMARMGKNQILSLPVTDENSVIGLLDLMDVVRCVVQLMGSESELKSENLTSLNLGGIDVGGTRVGTLIAAAGRPPYLACQIQGTLRDVVQYFATGIHRTVLVDTDDNPLQVLSQTDIVRYLGAQLDKSEELGRLASRSLLEVGILPSKVVTVDENVHVISAMKTLLKERCESLAVVDANGRMTSSFSARTARGLVPDELSALLQPIKEYVSAAKTEGFVPAKISLGITFRQLVKDLSTGVHRVWIVDDEGRPTGTIAMTDVMKVLTKW